MKVLDLFCGAGGASKGLADAGFEVVGIDCFEQPHYPFRFILQNVGLLEPDFLRDYDFIWASPPCQHHSVMTKRWGRKKVAEHRDWIPLTRKLLIESGVPYCIENVMGAPLINPVMLCGSMFGNQTRYGSQLRRHRIFEIPWFNGLAPMCNHRGGSVIGVHGGGQHPLRRRPPTIGVYGNAGGSSNRDGLIQFGTQDRRDAMGIQWMTGKELSQAIPPSYSKWIAEQFLKFSSCPATPKML